MTNMPALSFVIPCYNSEKYIAATLDSILNQPCQDFEIIVVDDGSTDNSPVIIDSYQQQYSSIAVIRKENQGVSCARNDGYHQAKGKYIAFLDSDDCLCINAYDQTINTLLLQDDYDIIGFGWIKANANMTKGNLIPVKNYNYLRNDISAYSSRINGFHFCSFLYRKASIADTPFPPNCSYNEDLVFLFLTTRVAKSIYSINKYWFIYRNNISSLVHTKNNIQSHLTDRINAWYWGKKHCTTRTDELDCEGNIFANIAQYINYSCRQGISLSTILNTISTCSILDEIMVDYDDFWKVDDLALLYNQFKERPYLTYARLRISGFHESFFRLILKNTLARKLYMSVRYKNLLDKYRAVKQN